MLMMGSRGELCVVVVVVVGFVVVRIVADMRS